MSTSHFNLNGPLDNLESTLANTVREMPNNEIVKVREIYGIL